jgi:hypothetical protein
MTPVPMNTIATAMIIRSIVSHSGMRRMAWSSLHILTRLRVGKCEPIHTRYKYLVPRCLLRPSFLLFIGFLHGRQTRARALHHDEANLP